MPLLAHSAARVGSPAAERSLISGEGDTYPHDAQCIPRGRNQNRAAASRARSWGEGAPDLSDICTSSPPFTPVSTRVQVHTVHPGLVKLLATPYSAASLYVRHPSSSPPLL